MIFNSKQYFLVFALIYSMNLSTQSDTAALSKKDFFALTAEDITRDERLVESLLNRKTSTASQIEQLASEAPATVYIISKEQIQNRGYENLLDILTDLSEVEIQQFGSPEFNQHISLRGVAGNEKFLILQDGVRISAPTDDTHSVGYNFSVEHAEQIEVIIGPASALYGADAFSGVIQIVTQKGQNIPLQVKSSYGNLGTTHNSLNFAKNFGDVAISLSGSYYYSNEPNFPESHPEEFSWYTEQYLPKGELLISPFLKEPVTGDLEGTDRKFEMPTESYFANVSLGFRDMG